MRLTFKELKQLPVETVSGVSLGHVHEIVFEDVGQQIVQYAVRSSVFGHDYLINHTQVLGFREGKMIVEDTVKRVEKDRSEEKTSMNPEPIGT